jgi:hypothetical protein
MWFPSLSVEVVVDDVADEAAQILCAIGRVDVDREPGRSDLDFVLDPLQGCDRRAHATSSAIA